MSPDTDLGSVPALDERTRTAALRTLCMYATDVDDALDLARALGLAAPDPDSGPCCRECGRPTSLKGTLSGIRQCPDGLCSTCYSRQHRQEKEPRQVTEPPRDRAAGQCVECGVEMGRRRDLSWKGAFYGGRDRCDRCYSRLRRAKAAK